MVLTPAAQWGAALRRSMTRRRVTGRALAKAAGVYPTTISTWVTGQDMPTLGSAIRVAEALDDDGLLTLMQRLRTRTCARCEREFLDGGNHLRAKWCSTTCRCAANAQERRGRQAIDASQSRGHYDASRFRKYQAVVDAFCRACEPEGLCRTPECPIKQADLSPLPLMRGLVRVA